MKAVLASLFDVLFGCRHANLSFPLSVRRGRRRPAAACQTGTYVVCLECGKEFAYDWNEMRIVTGSDRPAGGHRALEAES